MKIPILSIIQVLPTEVELELDCSLEDARWLVKHIESDFGSTDDGEPPWDTKHKFEVDNIDPEHFADHAKITVRRFDNSDLCADIFFAGIARCEQRILLPKYRLELRDERKTLVLLQRKTKIIEVIRKSDHEYLVTPTLVSDELTPPLKAQDCKMMANYLVENFDCTEHEATMNLKALIA